MIRYVGQNIDEACSFINENIPGVSVRHPEGTYLMWLDFNGIGYDDDRIDDIMINKAKLWLDDGHIFGKSGKGFQRINAACPKSVLFDALERIRTSLKQP